MKIENLYPGSYGSNCYLLTEGDAALVIDPSAPAQTILDRIGAAGAHLKGILLTHGHFDHILSLDALRDATGAPAMIHREDAPSLPDSEKNAYAFFFGEGKVWRPAEKVLEDDGLIPFGNTSLRVLHTPGHTAGSVCYLLEDEGILFSGDTLFMGGVGRTDLFSGNDEALLDSLKKLKRLPAPTGASDWLLYPGHGDLGSRDEALEPLRRICI